MRRGLGYILVALGIAAIAFSYTYVRTLIGIALPAQLTDLYLIIGGIVLIVIGGLFVSRRRSSDSKTTEVPIYHGNKVVGYRRH